MEEQTKTRNYAIQMLRGLAIVAVVFIHNTPSGMSQVFCRPFLNFSVGLFLFMSGMLSNAKKWNPKKRIVKVIVPYIIWTLVYVTFAEYEHPENIPILYIKNLITGKSAAMMYYVFVYCELTLLIPIIDKIARSKFRYWAFAISPAEIILMRLLPLVLRVELNNYVKMIMSISCLSWFSYYYLGYLLGNSIVKLKCSTQRLVFWWIVAIVLQIAEGYFYYLMGESNCGTQLKLSAILAGNLFCVVAFNFIRQERIVHINVLYHLGNASFGIYFSHIAVMRVLGKIPYYTEYVIYPLNAIIAISVSYMCAMIGKKILGRYGKYLAL